MFYEGEYFEFTCIHSMLSSKKKKMVMMNKRRFSEEQVKSLETIFENETKLEPKMKVQVARDLGLHPRQVAIWFQNKRARYKSKQLERDLTILRANYDALASRFDHLNKEKLSLMTQVQKLKDDLERKLAGETATKIDSQLEMDKNKNESESERNHEWGEEKAVMSMEGSEYGASMLSSDEGSSDQNTNHLGENDALKIMVEPIRGSWTSPEPSWDDLQYRGGLVDMQAVDGCQWWDFWS